MKILLTGCCGYIGSVLLPKLLRAGHKVIGIDNLIYEQGPTFAAHLEGAGNAFEFYNFDLTTTPTIFHKLVAQCDAVIPLAALVGMPVCKAWPTYAEDINLWVIRELIATLSKNQIVVYPNTNSGYGETDGQSKCDENTPMNPVSHYARTKYDAEQAVLSHPLSVCLRLATVFGASPRMRLDLLVNTLMLSAFRDADMVLYDRHAMRNYVHVEDVADCFCHCLKNCADMAREVYNLGNDNVNMSKLQLADLIRTEINPLWKLSFDDTIKDPDNRNYIVTSQKLETTGFKANRGIKGAIPDMLKLFAALPPDCSSMHNTNPRL